MVFSITCIQIIIDIFMTGATTLGRCVFRIGDNKRHMHLVTGDTVACCHLFTMRGMAFHTIRDSAMPFTMALCTCHGGMVARMLFQLGNLLSMTGKARICQVSSQGDVKRCMGVGMACKTTFQFEMGFPFMAITACGDIIPY
jgi:hypothetical protein